MEGMISYLKNNQGIILGTIAGILGTLALSDIGPDIAYHIRLILGVVLIVLAIWFLIPLLLRAIYIRVLSAIAEKEVDILKFLIKKYPKSHIVRLFLDAEYKNETVYAATAFVYKKGSNPTEFLWLLDHATHSDLLPPGGRLIANYLPHDAVLSRVSSETGIPKKELSFSPFFHKEYKYHLRTSGSVISHPLPIVIQSEIIEQKGGLPFHYDFIYVLETPYRGPLLGSQNPNWLDMKTLSAQKLNDKRFANVRLLAEELATRLEKGTQGPL